MNPFEPINDDNRDLYERWLALEEKKVRLELRKEKRMALQAERWEREMAYQEEKLRLDTMREERLQRRRRSY